MPNTNSNYTNYTPSTDQMVAQFRILIPALGSIVTTAGWLGADQVGPIVSNLMIAVGPVMYIIASVWSLYANSRASIMASAAKPVSPHVPPPEIVLPVEEKHIAETLPPNVSTSDTKKVIPCSGKSQ